MKIIPLKKYSKALVDFAEEEWKDADIEHYGILPDWKTYPYIFQAKDDKQIVGLLDGELQLNVFTIKQLIIAKSHRRKGIGKKLLEYVEFFAKENGAHKIYLSTGKDWKAEQFYTSLGYEECGEMPKHYLEKDFVEYQKFI